MGTGWLIRHQLRRRWLGVVALALVVALGVGGALVALGASQRTAHAYARYVDRAEVGDLVINPSLATTAGDDLIRHLPGVRRVTRAAFLDASMDDGHARTRAQLDAGGGQQGEPFVSVYGSTDGRFTRMDRLAYQEGRAPTGTREAVVTKELAAVAHVAVGDVVPVAFWDSFQDSFADLDAFLTPVGVEHVTVVGIATMPDEVLPDGVFPRGRIIVSPDVSARYDCLVDLPADLGTAEDAMRALFPDGCALSYPYYSLDLVGGRAGVPAVLKAFEQRAATLNDSLPGVLRENGVSYAALSTTTAQLQSRVERSVQPTSITLGVLAAGAGVVALVALGLAVARDHRRAEDDQRQWWRLGMTARERATVALAPHVVALVVGVLVGLGLAWVLSPIGPVGVVRDLDPSPSRELSAWVALAALGFAVVGVALVIGLALRATRRTHRPAFEGRTRAGGVRRALGGVGGPAVGQGIRATFVTRGSGLVVASGGLAAGVLLTAVVFGASLSSVVSTPAHYGWPWDAAVMTGFGYGSQDLAALEATMSKSKDVERWSALGFGSFSLDGRTVVSMVGLGPPARLDLTVVEGRLPTGKAEVAIGSRTAAAQGLGVGDTVRVAGEELDVPRATVTGIVVLPALGPFQADRAEPGTGMVLPAAMFPKHVVAGQISFVGMHLRDGVRPEQAISRLRKPVAGWAEQGDLPFFYPKAIRPPEIVNAAGMRSVPLLVGALLAVAAALGLAFAVAMSVRSRRRELGTLRALGFSGRQLRVSVWVQSTSTTIAALVIGIPLGIVVGRLAWRAFAERLGVATDPSISFGWVAATIGAGLLISFVAAALPARAAARTTSAESLRSE